MSVLAEIKLLRAFFSERISQESLVTLRAEIVAEMTIGGLDLIWIFVLFHFAQEFADRLHVIVVQIRFGNLRGLVRRKNLDLDHKALIVPGAQLLTAKITRNV